MARAVVLITTVIIHWDLGMTMIVAMNLKVRHTLNFVMSLSNSSQFLGSKACFLNYVYVTHLCTYPFFS